MPTTTRWFVRLAMAWLVVGLALRLLASGSTPAARGFEMAALHMLTVGWLTQLVIGVAIWLFPKKKGDSPRGSELIGWATFVSINLGVVLRSLSEPMLGQAAWAAGVFVGAAVLQVASALGFVVLMRGRIRG